jgi:hypothetical protein
MSCDICHRSPHDIHCPNANPVKIHGYCKKCYEPLPDDYTYWTDYDDNRFCSERCAEEWNKIEEKNWEEGDE